MKKRALLKTAIREVRNSPTRFLSILGIIFLGVAFFVGIGATGPDMINAANDYYQRQQLADVSVISTLGLTDTDQQLLEANPQVEQAQPQYTLDLNMTKLNKVIRFFGYEAKDSLNQYKIVAGRLPEKAGEVALDQVAQLQGDYQIGDTLTIEKADDLPNQLKEHQLKVVGFVNSPEFIENLNRGNTTVGSGTIDYFAVVQSADLDLETYSRILVSFKKAVAATAYSEDYQTAVDDGIKSLKQTLKQRPQARLEEVKATAEEKLTDVKKQIDEGEKALDTGAEKLEAVRKQLDDSKTQLTEKEQTLQEALALGQEQLDLAQTQLEQQQSQLKSQQEELTKQWQALDQANEQSQAFFEKQGDIDKVTEGAEQLQQELKQLQSLLADIVTTKKVAASQMEKTIAAKQRAWTEIVNSLPDNAALQAALAKVSQSGKAADLSTFETVVGEYTKTTAAEAEKWQKEAAEYAEEAAKLNPEVLAEKGQQLKQVEEQLQEADKQLQAGREELAQQRQTLQEQQAAGEEQLAEAKQELANGEAEYQKNVAHYQEQTSENMPKLLDAQLQLKNQTRQLAEMKPADYLYSDRDTNPGYTEYKQNANRISSLATVFPVIFFLIAALVSLTTMTRMIEEKRSEIGTFKALGYKNTEIAQKFILYSLTAGLLGTLAGLALGFYLFPTIIVNAYGQLYNMKEFTTPWYLSYTIIATVVALICTVGIALLTLRLDLRSSAAALLRPKAPKAGRRVWLERLTPVWQRMSFIQKVTVRNLFRYKSRMLMTIFGIAGCTSMIVTGFGLRDSIGDMVPLQFEKLWQYQGVVTFNDHSTDEQTQHYEETLKKLDGFKEALPISAQTLTLSGEGQNPQDVSVYVPQKPEDAGSFLLFNDRKTGEKYQLTDDGAIIDEKLAALFAIEVGDKLQLKSSEGKEYSLKVSAVVENYVGHFAYVTPEYFKEIFHEEPQYNSEFLLFDHPPASKQQTAIANQLMTNPKVVNVTFLSDSSDALDDTVGVLTIVVWVLIISAGLLALIVLYNLNNINISERIRELSTIKVLGFYNNELTMYIYRENIILTVLGIVAGLVLGFFEHRYVLQTVELDMLMFSPDVHPLSYLYATLITLFFTLVVGIVVYFKLKKVDMIEALKSNE